ncbi:hypothetical protein FN846DRAFT_908616 [Sphaerosporella brunnea]|uniref:Uncharacterized protein n=1 Tax=Sphaerosporella brunnea TaxID=1250544 RepID=A0A5J5ET74_9PEZI|nr:hypothetical protein FN846DRAFT_908616 [Sphaerosporella brunnea]
MSQILLQLRSLYEDLTKCEVLYTLDLEIRNRKKGDQAMDVLLFPATLKMYILHSGLVSATMCLSPSPNKVAEASPLLVFELPFHLPNVMTSLGVTDEDFLQHLTNRRECADEYALAALSSAFTAKHHGINHRQFLQSVATKDVITYGQKSQCNT